MKKVLALMLALVLVLSLAACGGSSNSEEKKTDTSSEAQTSEAVTDVAKATVYSIGDIITTDVAKAAVSKIEFADSFGPCKLSDDYRFVCVSFSFENIGKNDLYFEYPYVDYNDGIQFKFENVDQITTDYARSVLLNSNKTLFNDNASSYTIKPLSGEITCTCAICVPKEVVDNKDAPLLVRFRIPTAVDYLQDFAYKVR